MRKFILAVFLAGTAVSPALAQEWRDHGRVRHQQQDNGSADQPAPQPERHSARVDGGGSNRPQEAPQVEHRPPVVVQRGPSDEFGRPRFDRRDNNGPPNIEVQRPVQRRDGVSRWTRDDAQQPGETSRWTRDPDQRPGETARWTRDRTGGWQPAGSDLRQPDRRVPNVMRTPTPVVVDGARGGRAVLSPEARRGGGGPAHYRWNPDWRNDHRYDWRQWRERHRSTFHVGFYYDPFGYNYRQFEVGYRLTPAYFGQQYWISDPWDYQLPPPPPGAVWVRYWNDALLVDMYSGEVVDAIRNFFW